MFFFLMPFWSELIQVVKGCCVFVVSLERDPESAGGPWLCIKAGWASRWCRIQGPGSVVLLRHSYFHSLNCCLATVTTLTLVLD